MTTHPDLPRFEIPLKEPSRPPRSRIWAWMQDNLRRLSESGQLVRIKNQSSRTPVDRRFEL